jgi:hypothetical protein
MRPSGKILIPSVVLMKIFPKGYPPGRRGKEKLRFECPGPLCFWGGMGLGNTKHICIYTWKSLLIDSEPVEKVKFEKI